MIGVVKTCVCVCVCVWCGVCVCVCVCVCVLGRDILKNLSEHSEGNKRLLKG